MGIGSVISGTNPTLRPAVQEPDDTSATRRALDAAPFTGDSFELTPVKGPVVITATPSASSLDGWRARLSRPRDANTPAVPFDAKAPDVTYDGMLVGLDTNRSKGGPPVALLYDPARPLSSLAGASPGKGELLIYTNGIQTPTADQAAQLEAIAKASHGTVVGVRNSTEGSLPLTDRRQTNTDRVLVPTVVDGKPKFGIQRFDDLARIDPKAIDPALATLSETVIAELRAGRAPHLIAHSQGAAITSAALQITKVFLTGTPEQTGIPAGELERARAQFNQMKVETYGGAARAYPTGPQYLHVINASDFVPQDYGLLSGTPSQADLQARAGGATAVIQFLDNPGAPKTGITDLAPQHGFLGAYLPHRTAAFGQQPPLPDSLGVDDLKGIGVSDPTARALVKQFPLMDVLRNEKMIARQLPFGEGDSPGLRVLLSKLKDAGSNRSPNIDAIVSRVFDAAAKENPADPAQGVYSFLSRLQAWDLSNATNGKAPDQPPPPILARAMEETRATAKSRATR